MKKTLLMLVAVLVYCTAYSQITPGFTNDFEDGTTQQWQLVRLEETKDEKAEENK